MSPGIRQTTPKASEQHLCPCFRHNLQLLLLLAGEHSALFLVARKKRFFSALIHTKYSQQKVGKELMNTWTQKKYIDTQEKGKPRKIYNEAKKVLNDRSHPKTLASKMKIANRTRKFPNVTTKPTKHQQTNESPTIQIFPKKIILY